MMGMKSRIFAVLAVSMICCGISRGTVSIVKNGSFENDGFIGAITQDSRPEHWCDISFDEAQFGAYTDQIFWSTHGDYSLIMYTNLFTTFEPNDAFTMSQFVYLADAGEIIFDLYLAATDSYSWDPNVVTARVLIDDTEIWNSDGLDYAAGWFAGQIKVDVNQMFRDENFHKLSLQLQTDVGNLPFTQYIAQWDSVMFDTFCNNTGPQPADFNEDGIVDIYDLKVLTDGWLTAEPDLTGDGYVNFADFASFAGVWLSEEQAEIPCDTFFLEPDFILFDADLNDDGIVDYYDVFILCSDWLVNGGSCVRADLNEDGSVDFADYALLIEDWQQTGGLYGR